MSVEYESRAKSRILGILTSRSLIEEDPSEKALEVRMRESSKQWEAKETWKT